VAPKAVNNFHRSMEILEFTKEATKPIFAAKCGEGYVGCVKTDDFVCFTVEVYESALAAANKARSLKKSIESKHPVEAKEKNKTLAIVKTSSKKQKKKVTCVNKLYSLTETQAMPLLSFKEVWVITRGDKFVSDCINKEKKELCVYTNKQEKAKIFECHEEAKLMMRTLKGTVGPGFDLLRFFIRQ